MTKTTCHISISLDGFIAGPDQDRDNPLGVGGLRLHDWHLREAAGDQEVSIAGGASTVRQALTAGVIDELVLDIAPVVLGRGESPFHGVEDLRLAPIEVIHSPLATHVRYRVGGAN